MSSSTPVIYRISLFNAFLSVCKLMDFDSGSLPFVARASMCILYLYDEITFCLDPCEWLYIKSCWNHTGCLLLDLFYRHFVWFWLSCNAVILPKWSNNTHICGGVQYVMLSMVIHVSYYCNRSFRLSKSQKLKYCMFVRRPSITYGSPFPQL